MKTLKKMKAFATVAILASVTLADGHDYDACPELETFMYEQGIECDLDKYHCWYKDGREPN